MKSIICSLKITSKRFNELGIVLKKYDPYREKMRRLTDLTIKIFMRL